MKDGIAQVYADDLARRDPGFSAACAALWISISSVAQLIPSISEPGVEMASVSGLSLH